MNRIRRWSAMVGVCLMAQLAWGQGASGFVSKSGDSLPDSVVVATAPTMADSLAKVASANPVIVPAADSVVVEPATGLDAPVPGLPFTFLTLAVVGMCIVLVLTVSLLLVLEANVRREIRNTESDPNAAEKARRLAEQLKRLKAIRLTFAWAMGIFIVGFYIHQQTKGTPWEGHLNEWMNLVVRWAHITFGVAWIGASFYFIFLENSLYRGPNKRDELAGNLWAIHGGGFYYVEKYKVAPAKLPDHLHWFKWEAYITWISGVSLLAVVYYFNASSLLVDKNVADISNGAAIAIGVGTLVVSWFVYDILCRTPLVESKPVFFFLMLGYITFIAFFLSMWLSPRAAYIHVGAVIGTMMAGNVWRVIIPSQKAMVRAAEEGKPVDPELGRHAGLRSLHNNYFTLPVLFIMISNHFPSTYGNTLNWVVLGALTLISAGVKHYFNLKDKGEKSPLLIPAATVGLMIVFFVTAPRPKSDEATAGADAGKVEFYQVYQIMVRRCTPCHSAQPIDDVNVVAPNGIMFDTPEQIQAQKDRILVRAVVTKTMPQNNKTEMTEAERQVLSRWIQQGAEIK